jgi:hypothetical protein
MRAKKAVGRFLGRNGAERLNCAQSVASVFLDEGALSEQEFAELAGCGFGRAPQGCCGSAYAALRVLDKAGADKAGRFKNEFTAYAGSLACKAIRGTNKIKCFQTVKKAVELAEKIMGLP